MSRSFVVAVLALVGGLLLALGATSARAAFIADAPDPANDATSPDPGHDIVGAGFGYDRVTGLAVAAIKLRGEPNPDAPAFVSLVATTRTANGCNGPAVAFGSITDSFDASWFRFAGPDTISARGDAGKSGYRDQVQRFEITERALRGLRPDCVLVTLTDPANAQNVYDTAGPLTMRRLPSLSLRLGGLPERLLTGRQYRLKVTVSNPGDAPTGRVKVRLARVKGMSARPRTLTVRSIAPGKRRTATIAVRFGRGAAFSPELDVTATAGRLRAEATIEPIVKHPDRGGSGGGGDDGGGTPSVCTQYFPDFSGETGGSLGLVPCLR